MAGESVIRRQAMLAEAEAQHAARDVARDVAEDDYQSFSAALNSSARGRAFLAEFTRRNRHADTEVVLNVLKRIEEGARQQAAASPEADRIRQDLRALLDTLRSARPQSDNSPSAIKAATLAALIDFAQARIEAMVMTPSAAGEAEGLAAVPAPEQPELPIPHPAALQSPVMALVQSTLRAEPVLRVEPLAPANPPAPGFTTQQARRKNATVIPIVEFDYRAHQSGRPASLWAPPEDTWTALAPPAVSSQIVAPLVATPVIAAPAVEASAADVPEAALAVTAPALPAVETENKTEAEAETYELWLDPPSIARDEPATTHIPSEMRLPETTDADTTPADAAMSDTMSDTASAESAIATMNMPSAEAPTAEAALSTIETLMQQMENAAAPAPLVKGHAEVADPLAPIMALSEEERIALFT